MKRPIRLALAFLLGTLAAHQTYAAPAATLALPGKSMFTDDFAGRTDMAPKWKVGKGFFTVKDGVVTIAENPDDKHGAYAYINPKFPYKDVVIEYSVKFDGAKTCNLMINDSNYKGSHAGHILRTAISPGKASLADWKNGSMKNEIFDKMKDPATTDAEKKALRAGIKDKSADFEIDVDTKEWHTVRIEIVGDEMLMSIDAQPVAYLKSEGVDHPTKNAIGFEVSGKSVQVKDVKVWEAQPSVGWKRARDEVIASLKR